MSIESITLAATNPKDLEGFTFSARAPASTAIVFEGVGTLDPQPDITPLESVRISQMLTLAVANRGWLNAPDFAEFVATHGLQRHFKKG